MKNTIDIVTPCSRPYNLFKIATSIEKNFNENCRWHIIFDEKLFQKSSNIFFIDYVKIKIKSLFSRAIYFHRNQSDGAVGHGHRNYMLESISPEAQWIHFNDDDNIISSDFCGIENLLDEKYAAACLSQKTSNGSLRFNGSIPLLAEAFNMKTYHVDTAKLIYNISFIKKQRFQESYYEADGMFVEELYNKHSDFLFLKNKFAYYNFLDVP